jgi:hypothetical protein
MSSNGKFPVVAGSSNGIGLALARVFPKNLKVKGEPGKFIPALVKQPCTRGKLCRKRELELRAPIAPGGRP